jgi:hypothetical protein
MEKMMSMMQEKM